MSGLRALATRMGELDGGLGGIVLMSEGFTTDVPRARERRLPDLQGLVRAASRFRVLLYAFDPGAAPPPAPPDPARRRRPRRIVSGAAERWRARPAAMAARRSGPGPALSSRLAGPRFVLCLTFTSTTANDGRFHALQITSNRRDAQVRARTGYWAPLPSELRAATRLMTPPLLPTRALRRSPFIDSWFGLTVEPDGHRRVIFTWTPAARTQPRAEQAGGAARRRGAQGHDASRSGAVRRGSCVRQVRGRARACGPIARCFRRARPAAVRPDNPAGRRHASSMSARWTSKCQAFAARTR